MIGDTVLIIKNDFFDEQTDKSVEGYFFLIPDRDSMDTLFEEIRHWRYSR